MRQSQPWSVSSSIKLLIFSNSLPSIFVPLLLSLSTTTIPGCFSDPHPASHLHTHPLPGTPPFSLLKPHSFLTASLDKASWNPQSKLVLPVMPCLVSPLATRKAADFTHSRGRGDGTMLCLSLCIPRPKAALTQGTS